ncbi:hypothetical protein [Pseudomonas putida]|uniref:hypothetical protein n=1 Tax=Pseudomonas putida TaxID=303 RepID=UPI00301C2A9E
MIWIDEPGVRFGPFEDTNLYHIEQSPALAGLGDGIKKVEFVFSRPDVENPEVLFVEAKNTIPRETEDFFGEIKQKMLDSLVLWMLGGVNRHEEIYRELPDILSGPEAFRRTISLILVVPGIPDDYLPTATDKFRRVMSKDCRVWKINLHKVWVVNLAHARKLGLVALA